MATSYNPKIVTSGLVLCLDAANPKSYPGSGTTWSDLSGNGNVVTLSGNPVYSINNRGTFSFNGTSQYASTPHSAALNNGTAITVECMVYSTTWGTQTYPSFVGKGINSEWQLFYSSGDVGFIGRFCWRIGLPKNTYSTTVAANNTWYHLVGTLDSTAQRIYVNGNQEASAETTTIPAGSSRDVLVGAVSNPTISNYMNGNIPFVRIYNRALSASEVLQNFSAIRGRFGV
jgi:hypothetical protein